MSRKTRYCKRHKYDFEQAKAIKVHTYIYKPFKCNRRVSKLMNKAKVENIIKFVEEKSDRLLWFGNTESWQCFFLPPEAEAGVSFSFFFS
ncbi:hypothetical protein M413DRAFT_150395 [Hebeloma cylindrosporum]|uniref:Uncharacterized protein n=1 Tax=Hebeloma cylindrosporum TaxID=76867 RepID=A0A0C3BY73_HEBCY|nr:hypothetical protein M413DRAFT_150395 [Hebeloma cylindrosporum h7]